MRWITLFVIGTILCVASLAFAQSQDRINEFDLKAWSGKYKLSSGHEGEMSLGPNRTFVFVLPDEEHSERYVGVIKEAYTDGKGMTLHLSVLESRRRGIDVDSGKRTETYNKYDPPFEVILLGEWLKATPGPEEIIEGNISFQGSGSKDADWFRDKTGTFMIETGVAKTK